MNISLKILMASVLINAVNINASYCMEEKYKNKQSMEVKDKTELQKQLGMTVTFEQVYDEFNYVANNEPPYHRLVPAEKFFKYLFGNKGKNLEIILSYDSETIQSDLSAIDKMLNDKDVRKHCIDLFQKDEKLCENVANIINSTKRGSDYIKNNIIDNIILMQCMDISFKDILNKYNNSNFFKDILKKYEDSNRGKLKKEFFIGLFGNNGYVLRNILLFNILKTKKDELKAIYLILDKEQFENEKEKLNEKEKGKVRLKNIVQILDIVATKTEYEYIRCVDRYGFLNRNNLFDNVRRFILMKSLGIDVSFDKIKYLFKKASSESKRQQIMQDFIMQLFGSNCEVLKNMLYHKKPSELEYEIKSIKHILGRGPYYILNLLRTDKLLYDQILNIVNSARVRNNSYEYYNDFNSIITYYAFLSTLDIYIPFQCLYKSHIGIFCEFLFGNDGNNFKRLLDWYRSSIIFLEPRFQTEDGIDIDDLFHYEVRVSRYNEAYLTITEVYNIVLLLKRCDKYVINFLAKSNDKLLNNIVQIINNFYEMNQNKKDKTCTIRLIKGILYETKFLINQSINKRKQYKYVKNKMLPKLNNICNNIIGGHNNKTEISKYVNEFFDYLLGKDWLNLEDILNCSTEETLKLIAQVLDLHEVKEHLPIIRSNFIQMLVKKI